MRSKKDIQKEIDELENTLSELNTELEDSSKFYHRELIQPLNQEDLKRGRTIEPRSFSLPELIDTGKTHIGSNHPDNKIILLSTGILNKPSKDKVVEDCYSKLWEVLTMLDTIRGQGLNEN